MNTINITRRAETPEGIKLVTLEIEAKHPQKYYERCRWFAAREDAGPAARVVQFMDATGLAPSRREPVRRHEGHPGNRPCVREQFWFDHILAWRVRGLRGDENLMLTVEPYAAGKPQADAIAWAEQHGWQIEIFDHFGMWAPPATILILLAPPHNPAFGTVATAIKGLRRSAS